MYLIVYKYYAYVLSDLCVLKGFNLLNERIYWFIVYFILFKWNLCKIKHTNVNKARRRKNVIKKNGKKVKYSSKLEEKDFVNLIL